MQNISQTKYYLSRVSSLTHAYFYYQLCRRLHLVIEFHCCLGYTVLIATQNANATFILYGSIIHRNNLVQTKEIIRICDSLIYFRKFSEEYRFNLSESGTSSLNMISDKSVGVRQKQYYRVPGVPGQVSQCLILVMQFTGKWMIGGGGGVTKSSPTGPLLSKRIFQQFNCDIEMSHKKRFKCCKSELEL